jgi:hypothetical protein
MMQRISSYVYLIVACLFVIGVLVQVYLAGMVVVSFRMGWGNHTTLGHTLLGPLLLMLISMYLGRLSQPMKWLTWLLFGVYVFQVAVVILLRVQAPIAAALHPVLALIDFALGLTLVRRAWSLVRQTPMPTTVVRSGKVHHGLKGIIPMNGFAARITGWMAFLVGVLGMLATVSLILFFVGLFQHISSLSMMGRMNDAVNAIATIATAFLATYLHPTLYKSRPRLSLALVVGVWIGAIAVAFGSWLIMTDRADVEGSSYYYFFGNGLIGIWLWVVNRDARQWAIWPRNVTQLGSIAAAFMIIGLLGLYGILSGQDSADFTPLVLGTGISFLGIGILYPIWSLWLGSLLLSKPDMPASPAQS